MAELFQPTALLPLPIYELNDKFYVFKYKPTLNKSEFDRQNPILSNEQLSDANEKIFSWILGKNKSGEYAIFARESKDILELFSKHISLFLDVSCDHPALKNCITEVEYAGEMLVHNKKGEFNLLSGTYMKNKNVSTVEIGDIQTILTKLTGITFVQTEGPTMIIKTPDLKYIYGLNVLDIYEFDTKEQAELYNNINEEIRFSKQGIKLFTRKYEIELQKLQNQLTTLEAFSLKKPIQFGGKKTKKYFIKS
jgi:hypothetical protein